MCEIRCGRLLCYKPGWLFNCCVCPILSVPIRTPGANAPTDWVIEHNLTSLGPNEVTNPGGGTLDPSADPQIIWNQLRKVKKIFCMCPKVTDCWPAYKMWIKIPVIGPNGSLWFFDLNINPFDITKQSGSIKLPVGYTLPTGVNGTPVLDANGTQTHTKLSFFDIFVELRLAAGANLPNPIRFIDCDALEDRWVDLVACVPLPPYPVLTTAPTP